MLRRVAAGLVVAAIAATTAHAAEWGNIVPGTSTMDTVRAQYGGPTKTETQKVDNYDTTSWVYDSAQAPAGLTRMVIDFGILAAGGYRRDVVRSFKLEPKAGVFARPIVISGWGTPDRVGNENGADVFLYGEGLVVIFDKDGWNALTLLFTPPQPIGPEKPSR